jgi:methyl-accepting chemotaxis protein WspA
MQEPPKPSLIIPLLSRLSYPQKFFVITFFFGIALLISCFFMVRSQNQIINITEAKILGLHYQNASRKVMEDLIKHQIYLHNYLNGTQSFKSQTSTLSVQTAGDLHRLEDLDNQLNAMVAAHSDPSQYDPPEFIDPSELAKRWSERSNEFLSMTHLENEDFHKTFMEDIKSANSYLANVANLYEDSTFDTQSFTYAILSTLPQIQSLIPSLVFAYGALNESKAPNMEDKIRVAQLAFYMESSAAELKNNIFSVYKQNPVLKSDRDLENKLGKDLTVFLEEAEKLIEISKKSLREPTEISSSALSEIGLNTLNASLSLSDDINRVLETMFSWRLSYYYKKQFFSLSLTILGILIGFILGYKFMLEISRPLITLINAAKSLAKGDLSIRVPVVVEDEVGQVSLAFNQMAESLQELIGQLQWTGIQLTTSSTQIAAAAKEQESAVVEQESTTKQIAITAKEISTRAKDFAKTMSGVSLTAEQTSLLASLGKEGLTKMEATMQQMVDASHGVASKLSVLSEKAENITSVITTISKVADQTNLLSLNAAIEAEKAGEHGRSFTVIAGEIRRLADQTASATLDIEKMVNEIVSAISAGVIGVEKFSEEIHTGVDHVAAIGGQLNKIIAQVQKLTETFEGVNQGMQTQSLSAEQINNSINQLSVSTQQTTKSIRQFHNAFEQLNNAAKEMQTAVSKIKR